MIARLETQLVSTTRRFHSRDYALLQTIPGIGQALALTILYEIDTLERFLTVQDFRELVTPCAQSDLQEPNP